MLTSPSSPPAEVVVDTVLVRTLLEAQHPDLSGLPIEETASGWDNAMFRLGGELVARLPRRLFAVPLLEKEQKWLSTIATRLPIPVPAPLRIGKPGNGYPWGWSILPWLEGQPADVTPIEPGQAEPLAHFLRALHLEAPADAPRHKSRGIPLELRANDVEDRLRRLESKTTLVTPRVRDAWRSALQALPGNEPAWIHGDLHAGNVLVKDGSISGVIDWGDMASGDRATDLAAIWMLLPTADSRERAIAEYGKIAAPTWVRARGWAVLFGVLLLDTGLIDNPRHARMGELILRQITEGP